jgi:hypothetical protein
MYINMDMNLDFTAPLMMVVLCVGMMVVLNLLLPMLPQLPVVDKLSVAASLSQQNLLGSALYVALVVYLASLVKEMFKL